MRPFSASVNASPLSVNAEAIAKRVAVVSGGGRPATLRSADECLGVGRDKILRENEPAPIRRLWQFLLSWALAGAPGG